MNRLVAVALVWGVLADCDSEEGVRTAEGFLFPPPLVSQLNPADLHEQLASWTDFDLPSMIDLPDLKPGVQIYNADCLQGMHGDVYVKMFGHLTCRETCEASLPTGVCVDESQRKLDTSAAACRCAFPTTTDMEIFEDPTRLPGCYQAVRRGFQSFNALKSQPIGCDADRGGKRIEFGQTSRLCVCRSIREPRSG